MTPKDKKEWALILGASSGFGGATAVALAQEGMNIFGVHLDRKQTMPEVEKVQADIRATGAEAIFFNINAADKKKRTDALRTMVEYVGSDGYVKVLMHSLAFGTLLPFLGPQKERMNRKGLEMTLHVMAHSLIYWTQGLLDRKLFRDNVSKIFAMTSAGGCRVWTGYGAISAAKATLESHIRQLALELAPKGITANTIRAGVTDTPALRKIPRHERMLDMARSINPGGRLTQPADVAEAITRLSQGGNRWMTGNIIGIDGGEFNAG